MYPYEIPLNPTRELSSVNVADEREGEEGADAQGHDIGQQDANVEPHVVVRELPAKVLVHVTVGGDGLAAVHRL